MGRASVPTETVTLDMSSTNVASGGTYTLLKAALANDASEVEVINPSTTPVMLGIGGAGVEQGIQCWHPLNTGARGLIPNVGLSKGARLSVTALTGTVSAGTLIVNLYK